MTSFGDGEKVGVPSGQGTVGEKFPVQRCSRRGFPILGTRGMTADGCALFALVEQGTEGGGAALDQVVGMSIAAMIVGAGLLWIGYQHRMRKITWLQDLGVRVGHTFHRPAWVALPMALLNRSMYCMYLSAPPGANRIRLRIRSSPGTWCTRSSCDSSS